jgi:hypothetical protein
MDVALALLVRAAAFLVFLYASRLRGFLRYLLPVVAAPFLLALLNYAYMVGIPERFLIEDVDAPEKTDWSVACTIDGIGSTDDSGFPLRAHPRTRVEALRLSILRDASRRFSVFEAQRSPGPAARIRELELEAPPKRIRFDGFLWITS